MLVNEILRVKGAEVITTRPEVTLAEVAQLLTRHRIGALVVLDDRGIAGVISERDLVGALAAHGADAVRLTVADVMTHDVQACAPDATIHAVMSQMTERRIRHVPVVEKGEMVGLISIGDVVKHRVGEIENEAQVLRDYVTAR